MREGGEASVSFVVARLCLARRGRGERGLASTSGQWGVERVRPPGGSVARGCCPGIRAALARTDEHEPSGGGEG